MNQSAFFVLAPRFERNDNVLAATVPANRARTQGTVDVFIAVAGAGGGALSGLVVAQTSYAVLSIAGGIFALLLIPVIFWAGARSRKLAFF